MKFVLKDPDYNTSPYTGLTRKHWIEAGQYLLEGIFQHVKDLDTPVLVPRFETKITYPNEQSPEWKKQAEIFEGVARSFFLAAPLLSNNPEITAGGISIKEYYKKQVLDICTLGNKNYVFTYEDMLQNEGMREPLNAYQQTVETCALVICLWVCREVIWDTYTKEEQKVVLDFIRSYAHQGTVPSNWRLFNMLDLAFLYINGEEIDEDIMRHHAAMILNYYAGDGWYRDGESFDYYSVWAFQVYIPIWCQWYGYEKEPYLAEKFEAFSNAFMKNYPALFDGDGWVNMWGRSGLYKYAAVSAFTGNFFLNHAEANPGLSRRICSGALMQFLNRDDVLYKGSLTLGFYKTFLPLLQGYSCAESPLWAAKAFLCLWLPETHPFWNAKEENGIWDTMTEGMSTETVLNGPALCLTNHKDNNTTELRSGKVTKRKDDIGGICCYAKLAYNTKYPWEAFVGAGVEAQMYMIEDKEFGKFYKPNALLWHGEKQGVLYRRNFFGYEDGVETHWNHCIDLADFPVNKGILRVDRLRLYKGNIKVTLGSYGFPNLGEVQITELSEDDAKAIILKGYDSQGRKKQMAMTIFDAWENLELTYSSNTNADAENSLIISSSLQREKLYGYEPFLMISQVITKEDFTDFTRDEIFSVEKVVYTDTQNCGGYGPVKVYMKDGRCMVVDYLGVEGNLQI